MREALVDAAAQLLSERGPAGVSLREAARRAGVSQSAPYHYFPSKSALLAAVGDAAHEALDGIQAVAISRAGSHPIAQLSALVTCYIRFALERPHYFTAMAPRLNERVLDAVRAARLAAGYDDLDPDVVATLVWAVPHGLATLYISGTIAGAGATPVMVEQLARAALEPLLAIAPHDVGGEWAV